MGYLRVYCTVAALVCGAGVAPGSLLQLAPPEPGYYVLDHAGMLNGQDLAAVDELTAALAYETSIPVYVVTMESMAAHGGGGYAIESFARRLYEQWGEAPDFDARDYWRHGILVVVSRGDRKARIELGLDWGGNYDDHCARIMDSVMVPAFRKGDFSYGITEGVRALDAMARGGPPPPAAEMADWLYLLLFTGGVLVAILFFWFLAWLLRRLNPPSRREYSIGDDFSYIDQHGGNISGNDSFTDSGILGYGGFGSYGGFDSFGGGGFGGGGFGGGGGATGSW